MRADQVALVAMFVASVGVSSFILGRNAPVRRATDIPTRQEVIDAMAEEVGLDEGQRRSVREIQDRYHDQLLKLQKTVEPDIARIRSEVRADTRKLLNPEQQWRFDVYCERRDHQRAEADR